MAVFAESFIHAELHQPGVYLKPSSGVTSSWAERYGTLTL
jgi:hypothetical protein